MPYDFKGNKAYKKGEPDAKPIPKKQALAIMISERRKGKNGK